jgi:hypothetical protein
MLSNDQKQQVIKSVAGYAGCKLERRKGIEWEFKTKQLVYRVIYNQLHLFLNGCS